MKNKFRGLGQIFKKTYKGWNADDPFRQSAVIAYYAIFSLPALLVLIINVIGFFFEREAINGEISRQISGVMGEETADSISEIIEKAGAVKAGLIPGIIAVVTIIFGATGVFVQLQKTLNQIWDVKEKENLGFLHSLKNRLFSFGLILSIGFLMLTSLVISSVLAAMSHWLEGIFPEGIAYLFYAIEFIVSLGVISVLFALMFKYLPDAKIKWKNIWIGAVVTGTLFLAGKYGLSFYFGKAEPGSVYGAAGSIILVLLWVSYSSMIVFFGAEFTKQYALFHDVKIEPTADAIKIKQDEDGRPLPGQATDDEKKGVHKNDRPKKFSSHEQIETEIRRLDLKAKIKKEEIKESLKPVNLVHSIIKDKVKLPDKDNQQLKMDGLQLAINLLTEKLIFTNGNTPGKDLTKYALNEVAKNMVYGESDEWVNQVKGLLQLHKKDPYVVMEDPVEEFYRNM